MVHLATGLTAVLHNVPKEFIQRFREQLTLVDCQFQDESVIRKAVWSCFQENPVEFRGQMLFDQGAFPEPPLSGKLTGKVTQPGSEPGDDSERRAKQKGARYDRTAEEEAGECRILWGRGGYNPWGAISPAPLTYPASSPPGSAQYHPA